MKIASGIIVLVLLSAIPMVLEHTQEHRANCFRECSVVRQIKGRVRDCQSVAWNEGLGMCHTAHQEDCAGHRSPTLVIPLEQVLTIFRLARLRVDHNHASLLKPDLWEQRSL
jgi:hypothetical protein